MSTGNLPTHYCLKCKRNLVIVGGVFKDVDTLQPLCPVSGRHHDAVRIEEKED